MREKFRDSDVELRNSASAREGDDNDKKSLTKTTSKNLKNILYGGIITSFIFFIAIIITYFLVIESVNSQVKSISEVFILLFLVLLFYFLFKFFSFFLFSSSSSSSSYSTSSHNLLDLY